MQPRYRFTFAAFGLLAISLIAALLFVHGQTTRAAAPDLFISEYIEGSSNNKAIEIYNGTGADVNLAAGLYDIQMYFNGNTSAGLTIPLTGSVNDGDVYVIANSGSSIAAILAAADQTNGGGWFNGNDVVVLRKNEVIIDAIGQIGVDPGSQWPGGGQDDTLRRAAAICAGDTNPTDAFDASVEWTVLAQNTVDGLGSHTADCGDTTGPEPVINEFSASTTGADVEYVEIFGEPNTDYSAYTILEIEGDFSGTATGMIDEVISMGTSDASGFYLANLPANALENGSLTLLLVKNFSGAFGDDLDTDEDGSLDNTPWEVLVDAVAVNDGGSDDLTYAAVVLGRNYDGVSSFAPGGASRIPDGAATSGAADWVRNDFDLAGIAGYVGTLGPGEALNTPGAPNEVYVAPPEACGDPFTPIYAVQGSGADSPLANTEVAIEGIVVGDFQNNAANDSGNLNGFHVQDPIGDGDPTTSDGVFVYAPGGIDVNVGDAVRVRGGVSEFNGMTEVTASQIWVCSTENSVAPTTVSLPLTSVSDLERYEGMLVTFPQTLYISEYFNFDRFGEIVLTTDRRLTPTAQYEPGSAEANSAMADYLLNRITLDDGRTNQNPDPAIHPNGAIFNLDNRFRGGDTVTNVTGVLDYSFGLYRVQPTTGADYASVNPRTDAPDAVGGSIKVASFNVLNYFTTLDNAGSICGPAQNQDCRGADTAEEFTRQRAKIIAAITAINADIVGLIEIENHPAGAAIADLVSGLNDLMGAGTYASFATDPIGTDAIRVAFIYKPATVSLRGDYAVLDSSVDARFIDDKNRPVLAQTFQDNVSGGLFTVAVNHLKSKGSDCNDLGDPDTGDGAGNCNQTRTDAAAALVDWLATDPTGSGDADFLIIGDLNAYDKEDPIDAIRSGADDTLGTSDDYIDLLYYFLGEDAYSYVFDGQIGYLDHALANQALFPEVSGVTVWHINADEPDILDYDTSFKKDAQDALYEPNAYRASDHDPVIIGLNVCDEIAPTLSVALSTDKLWPPNHQYVEVMATVTGSDNVDADPTITLLSATSNEPDNGTGDGDQADDIVVVNDTTFNLRAERAGNGTGRIYTLTYEITDDCGNSTIASAEVVVPLNQKDGKDGKADGTVDGSATTAEEEVNEIFLPLIQN